jgi:hypothetical protein
MPYLPDPFDDNEQVDAKRLSEYVKRQLQKIGDALALAEDGRFETRAVSPTRPEEAQIAYADGSNWNPGSGEGYYYFDGAAWQFMGPQTVLTAKWKCDSYGAGAFVWTRPTNVSFVIVELLGAGGGGGGRDTGSAGRAGGGGGGEWKRLYMQVTADINVVVGAGGIAGVNGAGAAATNGGNGGQTSITHSGVTQFVRGGGGGVKNAGGVSGTGGQGGGILAPAAPAVAVAGVDAVYYTDGATGGSGSSGGVGAGATGGDCGNNIGGARGATVAGGGGASYLSPGGDANASAVTLGAGGGGADTVTISAAGGDGLVRIYYLLSE